MNPTLPNLYEIRGLDYHLQSDMNPGSHFELVKPQIQPPLDPGFRPAVLANHAFRKKVKDAGGGVPLVIGVEAENGRTSTFETRVFSTDHPSAPENLITMYRSV